MKDYRSVCSVMMLVASSRWQVRRLKQRIAEEYPETEIYGTRYLDLKEGGVCAKFHVIFPSRSTLQDGCYMTDANIVAECVKGLKIEKGYFAYSREIAW